MTRIFLDTEFSGLSAGSELISVGAVAGNDNLDSCFYVELTPFPMSVSAFVRESVTIHLQGGAVLCPRKEFAKRFSDWLAQWIEPRIIVDSEWDIVLLRRTLEHTLRGSGDQLQVCALAIPIEIMSPVPDADLDHYFEARDAQQCADPRIHHALADAKVLRAGEMARRDLN